MGGFFVDLVFVTSLHFVFSFLVFFISFLLGKFSFCFIFKNFRACAHILVVPLVGATRPASPDSPLSARGAYLKRAVSNFQPATLFDASWWRFLFSWTIELSSSRRK